MRIYRLRKEYGYQNVKVQRALHNLEVRCICEQPSKYGTEIEHHHICNGRWFDEN